VSRRGGQGGWDEKEAKNKDRGIHEEERAGKEEGVDELESGRGRKGPRGSGRLRKWTNEEQVELRN
jgi:hypothetical protein